MINISETDPISENNKNETNIAPTSDEQLDFTSFSLNELIDFKYLSTNSNGQLKPCWCPPSLRVTSINFIINLLKVLQIRDHQNYQFLYFRYDLVERKALVPATVFFDLKCHQLWQ